jgi:hypothetical protein
MAVKLLIRLQKKNGLPDYGSLGAGRHVVVELDDAVRRVAGVMGEFHGTAAS